MRRMKLDAYIRLTGETEEEIARKAHCTQSTVNKVRNGKINPTHDLLRRISAATEGAFTPNDFEPIQPVSHEAAE